MSKKIGVILSFVAMVFEALSTLLITPLMIKTIGGSEYGVYKMCVAIVAYVMLLDLGVGNSIIRFVSKYRFKNDRESMKKFMGTTTIFYFVIAALSLLFGFLMLFLFPYIFGNGLTLYEIELGKKLVFITSISSAITLASTGFANSIVAYEKFIISRGLVIVQSILKLIFSFIVLKQGYGCIGVALVNLAVTVVVRLFFVVYALIGIKIPVGLKGISVGFIKEILLYSGLITVQMLATQINQSIDQILIGSLVFDSSIYLGIYAVGAQVNQYYMSIGTAITGVLMPSIMKLVTDKCDNKIIQEELTKYSRIIFYVLALIYFGFIVLGKQFIHLWAGEENIQAYNIALILMLPQAIYISISPALQLLWAKNENRELSIAKISIVVANIALTIGLLYIHPLFGPAIGTVISIFCGDIIVLLFVAKKKSQIQIGRYIFDSFGSIVLGLFLVTILFFGVMRSLEFGYSWIVLVIVGAIYLIVAAISLFLFSFNEYEKSLINIFKRFRFKGSKRL